MSSYRIRLMRSNTIVEIITCGNNVSDAVARARRKIGEDFNYLDHVCIKVRKTQARENNG